MCGAVAPVGKVNSVGIIEGNRKCVDNSTAAYKNASHTLSTLKDFPSGISFGWGFSLCFALESVQSPTSKVLRKGLLENVSSAMQCGGRHSKRRQKAKDQQNICLPHA